MKKQYVKLHIDSFQKTALFFRRRSYMRQFNLYISGVFYGKVSFDNEKIRLSELDIYTAKMTEESALSDERADYLKSFTKMDFELIAKLIMNEALFGNGNMEIKLDDLRWLSENGTEFMQRDIKFPLNVVVEAGKIIAFMTPAREMVTILVEDGKEDKTVLKDWKEAFPNEVIHPIGKPQEYMVPMRDGVKLAADVYLPADLSENLPTVLVRTPYGKELGADVYYRYVQRGYAVVVEDVRGRNRSEGEWIPNYFEVEDGDDTLNWIAEQNWSSGRVGMVGGSYLGYVQWAAAASANPHLKALISVVCAGGSFIDIPRRGGTMTSGMMAWAFAVSQKTFKPELMERDDWDEVLNIRPLSDLPKKALGYSVPFLEKWTVVSDNDEFWQRSSWHDRSKGAKIPALIQSGWYDDNGMGTTEALELVHDFPAEDRKVILGPWQHSGNSKYDMHGVAFKNNALRFDLDLIYFRWFEKHLKEIENGIGEMAPVQYYTVGEGKWKTAQNWPIPEGKELSLYLGSNGHANTSAGDGVLTAEMTSAAVSDSYDYDPKNPATHIIDMSENEIEVPEDYTEEEKREDILCFTTEAFKEPLTITGDAMFELYVSSDAVDTDFFVRITDVDENGRSIKHSDGVISARYRNSFEKAEFMENGEIYKINIRTTKFSNCFLPGHKLRVTITSSAKNFMFPNSNTKEGYCGVETVVAHNTIHHSAEYPSRVILRAE